MKATTNYCVLVTLPRVEDTNNVLTSLKENTELPFGFKRVFYLYDIPDGESRGGHSHKACHRFMIAVSGSFDSLLDDGVNKSTLHLNNPKSGFACPTSCLGF